MSCQIKVIIEMHQPDENNKKTVLRITADKEVDVSTIESLDDCEKNLMEVSYAAMRNAMSTQMSFVSKKKALQHRREED